jgi:hypothetical protein
MRNRLRLFGRAWHLSLAALWASTVVSAPPLHAQGVTSRTEALKGRVTTDSGRAVVGATVLVTMAPSRIVQQAITDSAGLWAVEFESGTGEYLVFISAVGYRPYRRLVALSVSSPSLNVDVALQRDVGSQQLAAVRVQARRPRPAPDLGLARSPTTRDDEIDRLTGLLPPELAGNLSAMAVLLPGFTMGEDGQLSVFGTKGQVSTTINGIDAPITDVPRDAVTQVRVTTSTYDACLGGFGGAQLGVVVGNGPWLDGYTGRVTMDSPELQFGDPVARTTRRPMGATGVSLGGYGNLPGKGPNFNAGLSLNGGSSGIPSLLTASAAVLSASGVAPDSLAHLREALRTEGVPESVSGRAEGRHSQRASFIGSVLAPGRWLPGIRLQPRTSQLILTAFANANRLQTPGRGPSSLLTTGSESFTTTAQVNAQLVRWLGDYLVTEFDGSLGVAASRPRAYLDLPSGEVLISSVLADSAPALRTVAIGGLGRLGAPATSWRWHVLNRTQFYAGQTHRIKVCAESNLDAGTQGATKDFGSFFYGSIADLGAGTPASFSRTVGSKSVASGQWSGAFSVGDLWQVAPTFHLEFGARVEANRFLSTPATSSDVSSRFELRSPQVPNSVAILPRIGFAWRVGGLQSPPLLGGVGGIGSVSVPPLGLLSGGVAAYRHPLAAALLYPAMASTGLRTGPSRLFCLGDAVPLPDWPRWIRDPSSVPAACATGTSARFAEQAPHVVVFDRGFESPQSWRVNLNWSSALSRIHYSIGGSYSVNVRQRSALDLNFASRTQFVLGSEGDRPVFVPAADIVPATGVLSPVAARVTPNYGNVESLQADGSSRHRMLTVRLVPEFGRGSFQRALVSFSYALSHLTEETRGFGGGTTFFDPRALERSRGSADFRHQFNLAAAFRIVGGFAATASASVLSGAPYTPIIASDVNGDGLANDRAFVVDPVRTGDARLASGMRSLIARASDPARACLETQLNRPAGRNSCSGPWTASLNLAAYMRGIQVLDGRRFQASVTVHNALGGLDQLLHGASGLRGWGVAATPQDILYYVRGFDPSERRYLYEVNPRFGSTRPAETAMRAPLRITLDLSLELGEPFERQVIRHIFEPGRDGRPGQPLPTDSIRLIYRESTADIYRTLILQRDSLLLTQHQIAELERAGAAYSRKADLVWTEFANWAQGLGREYSARSIQRGLNRAYERINDIVRAEVPFIKRTLTPLQVSLAYGPIADVLRSPNGRIGWYQVLR